MRLFEIESDGKFREFKETPFQAKHEESILEEWLEENPDGIIEDGKLLIIGRQVSTNLSGFIDLLCTDKQGDVVVVELKRDRTPRDTLAQALEYASFVEGLDTDQLEDLLRAYFKDESIDLAEHHRSYFNLEPEEAVAFNKDQRIVIVGQRITPEIRQTSTFLRSKGIRVTCVEFSFFETHGGKRLLSQEIVIGKEPRKLAHLSARSSPSISESDFIKSLDEYGKHVFSQILDFAAAKSFPIHWGTKGFSLNIDLDGNDVSIFYAYPPNSISKQSINTTFGRRGGILDKTNVPENVYQSLLSEAQGTGLFQKAGRELKCLINREFSQEEIDSLTSWFEKVAQTATQYGLKD